MSEQNFGKILTANDTGKTGGHQAGIHIPKSQTELLALLPPLDVGRKNPDAWIEMTDEMGMVWKFRYIHYNNKLHDAGGTRNEYRVTHMTAFFRAVGAKPGDTLVLSGEPGEMRYQVSVRAASPSGTEDGAPARVRLRGWHRVH